MGRNFLFAWNLPLFLYAYRTPLNSRRFSSGDARAIRNVRAVLGLVPPFEPAFTFPTISLFHKTNVEIFLPAFGVNVRFWILVCMEKSVGQKFSDRPFDRTPDFGARLSVFVADGYV